MLTVSSIELEQRTGEYIEHVKDAVRNSPEGKLSLRARQHGATLKVKDGVGTLKFSVEE